MSEVRSSRIPVLKEENIPSFAQNYFIVDSQELSRPGRITFQDMFDLAIKELVERIKLNPQVFDDIMPVPVQYPVIEDLGNMIRGYLTEAVTINLRSTTSLSTNTNLTFRGANVIFLGAAQGVNSNSPFEDYIVLDALPNNTTLQGWTYGGSSQFGTGSSKYYFFRNSTLGAVGESLESLITNLGIEVGERSPSVPVDPPVTPPVDPPAPISGFTLAQFSRFLTINGEPITINGEPLELI